MYNRDIHLLLFYSIWTLRTTPIQLVSVLFIAALYTDPSSGEQSVHCSLPGNHHSHPVERSATKQFTL